MVACSVIIALLFVVICLSLQMERHAWVYHYPILAVICKNATAFLFGIGIMLL